MISLLDGCVLLRVNSQPLHGDFREIKCMDSTEIHQH